MLLNRSKRRADPPRRTCPLRSDCRREADRTFVKDLFASNWEAFVIRHDPVEDKYYGFTICCESASSAVSCSAPSC
jgi:hypothetical protein